MKNNDYEARREGNNRFGNRIPNRYTTGTIDPSNFPVYNQLATIANLEISLGSHVCFYTNKLNHKQFDDLMATISDPSTRRYVNNSQKNKKAINWLSTTAYTPQGKKPCESMVESINLYNAFDLDQESKKITSYGIAELQIDFSKLNLVPSKEDGLPLHPFGIIFFSDITNGYDDYSATISCMPERINDVLHYKFINPISLDVKDTIYCRGKFRYGGNFIVFYVDNEIEREEGKLYPDVTMVNVSVSCFRDQRNRAVIKETGVTSVKKGSNCVADAIDHLIKDVFSFYRVTDQQFIGEIVHAFGLDPVELGLPPSLGDERSRYYNGNHAHMSSKGHHARHEKQPSFKSNIFDYLKEINARNEENVVLEMPPKDTSKDTPEGIQEEKDRTPHKDKQHKNEKRGKSQEGEVVYSDDEIDSAFAVADSASSPEGVSSEISDEVVGDTEFEGEVSDETLPSPEIQTATLQEGIGNEEDTGEVQESPSLSHEEEEVEDVESTQAQENEEFPQSGEIE
jgi:hypothetical protein